jgi:hypothetical protein
MATELELEHIFGIRKKQWQKMRVYGKGPRYYKLGGTLRSPVMYDISEVADWLKSRPQGGSAA